MYKIAFRRKVLALRKKGKSYSYISRDLGIAKSTLSYWLKNENFSKETKKHLIKIAQIKAKSRLRLLAIKNKEKWEKIHEGYKESAKQDFSRLICNSLFIPGLIIYWGEGDKNVKNGIVRVSNVDYRLLKIFIAFLLQNCNVKLGKIRAWILIYEDLNDKDCKKYWSKNLGLPESQFVKSQCIKGREKTKKVSKGVCTIQIYSREIKEIIIEWINLYFQMLNDAGMV